MEVVEANAPVTCQPERSSKIQSWERRPAFATAYLHMRWAGANGLTTGQIESDRWVGGVNCSLWPGQQFILNTLVDRPQESPIRPIVNWTELIRGDASRD